MQALKCTTLFRPQLRTRVRTLALVSDTSQGDPWSVTEQHIMQVSFSVFRYYVYYYWNHPYVNNVVALNDIDYILHTSLSKERSNFPIFLDCNF